MRRQVLQGPRGDRWVADVPTMRRERVLGLLERDRLPSGHALLIPRARSVHTIGMRFPITVAFLDASLRVIEVRPLPPGRIALPRHWARHVLELPAGADIRPGDVLNVLGDLDVLGDGASTKTV